MWPIEWHQCFWPFPEVIPCLQAFSSAIRLTFVQYFARFQLTVRSRGPWARAGLRVFISEVALLWKKDYPRKTACVWLCGYDAAFVKWLWPLVFVLCEPSPQPWPSMNRHSNADVSRSWNLRLLCIQNHFTNCALQIRLICTYTVLCKTKRSISRFQTSKSADAAPGN